MLEMLFKLMKLCGIMGSSTAGATAATTRAPPAQAAAPTSNSSVGNGKAAKNQQEWHTLMTLFLESPDRTIVTAEVRAILAVLCCVASCTALCAATTCVAALFVGDSDRFSF